MAKKQAKMMKHRTGKKTGSRHWHGRTRLSRTQKKMILLSGISIGLLFMVFLMFQIFFSVNERFSDSTSQDEVAEKNGGGKQLLLPLLEVVEENEASFNDFMGSETCKDCHAEQYALWRNSTHGNAGGQPGNVKIIANFDGKPLYFKDAVVRAIVKNDGEYIFSVEQEDSGELVLRVAAVVGGGHIEGGGTQSFFAKYPDGTLRFLPFDFSRDNDHWFVQLREGGMWVPISKSIALKDLMNWPPQRILGEWDEFSNCQNCHGSQILIQYNSYEKRYVTNYQTFKINCESCHGPGRKHVDFMHSPNSPELVDIGMEALATFSKDQSLNVCFQCHATKAALKGGYITGKSLEAHYALKFPIFGDENPYLVDGRIRTFAYQQNHLFSDCYLNGSMTCVDCHDPHSQEYRDVFRRPLKGKFDNGQCLGCHASKARTPELHSHHKPDSEGNLCTSCHMPFLQQQEIGNHVRYKRADHTISIPRPEFDAILGIENACKQCHSRKSIAWLQNKTEEWYGEVKPHHELIIKLMQVGLATDRKSASQLLLIPGVHHPMAQVTGLSHFIKRYLRPNMPFLEPEIIDKLEHLADSEDIDLKSLALMSLHFTSLQNPEVQSFLVNRLKSLGKDEEAIRTRWAIAVDYLGSLYSQRGDFKNAIKSHRKALEVKPNDAVTLVNLGLAYWRIGDYGKAFTSLEKALQFKPYDPSIYFSLAQLYATMGQITDAINALNEGLSYDPSNENARTMLKNIEALNAH